MVPTNSPPHLIPKPVNMLCHMAGRNQVADETEVANQMILDGKIILDYPSRSSVTTRALKWKKEMVE